MEAAIGIAFLAGSATWWKLRVIGKAELYKRIERWARIKRVANEAYDKAQADQTAKEAAKG